MPKYVQNISEFHKYFKIRDDKQRGEQLVVDVPKIEMNIPLVYFETHIAEIIGGKIETFGFLTFNVWEEEDWENYTPVKIQMTFPSKFLTCPDRISNVTINKDKYYTLEYYKGDLFMDSLTLQKNANTAANFVDILFKGKIPEVIPYDKLLNYWMECNTLNGLNLRVSSVVLQLIISILCRNPDNITEEFRKALRDNPKLDMLLRETVNINKIPQLTSQFAALSSADPKHALTATIGALRSEEGKNQISPIEEAIH